MPGVKAALTKCQLLVYILSCSQMTMSMSLEAGAGT